MDGKGIAVLSYGKKVRLKNGQEATFLELNMFRKAEKLPYVYITLHPTMKDEDIYDKTIWIWPNQII